MPAGWPSARSGDGRLTRLVANRDRALELVDVRLDVADDHLATARTADHDAGARAVQAAAAARVEQQEPICSQPRGLLPKCVQHLRIAREEPVCAQHGELLIL